MNTPDFMPVLSHGRHDSPSEGACIMEMAGFLAGEEWSDQPRCVNWMLAGTARDVNDALPNSHRHLILPLLGRLMGTTAKVSSWQIGQAVDRIEFGIDRDQSVDEYTEHLISGLVGVIDEYDRLSGRTAHREVTQVEMQSLMELVGAR